MILSSSSISLLSADAQPLGRVDTDSFSEQTLMELLVSQFDDTAALRDENGDFIPIENWPGVGFSDEFLVDNIVWHKIGILDIPMCPVRPGGSIDFQWLPRKLRSFAINGLQASGSIDTSVLPRSLIQLTVPFNQLTGTFSIASLPCQMKHVSIANNGLSGSLHIHALPRHVERFRASRNAFSGTLDFSNFPEGLRELQLDHNRLSGTIDLRNIPPMLDTMSLYQNPFEESTIIVGPMPESLARIDINYSCAAVVDIDGNPIRTMNGYGYRYIMRNKE